MRLSALRGAVVVDRQVGGGSGALLRAAGGAGPRRLLRGAGGGRGPLDRGGRRGAGPGGRGRRGGVRRADRRTRSQQRGGAAGGVGAGSGVRIGPDVLGAKERQRSVRDWRRADLPGASGGARRGGRSGGRLPGAGGLPGATRSRWPDRAGRGRLRGGRLPPSHEPGRPAAASYPRGRGQSCSRLGRAVVGIAWVSDLPARQGRWLAVPGPPAGGRPRPRAVDGVGAGAQRDGRARRRAARRARALLAPARGDPGMAGGRATVGPAVGGEGRAGHALAEGRPGGAGAVVRARAGRGGRTRIWPRRAGRTDPAIVSVPRPDRSTSTGWAHCWPVRLA